MSCPIQEVGPAQTSSLQNRWSLYSQWRLGQIQTSSPWTTQGHPYLASNCLSHEFQSSHWGWLQWTDLGKSAWLESRRRRRRGSSARTPLHTLQSTCRSWRNHHRWGFKHKCAILSRAARQPAISRSNSLQWRPWLKSHRRWQCLRNWVYRA